MKAKELKKLPQLDLSARPELVLGKMAKDRMSGMEGVVTIITDEVDGGCFVGITPRGVGADGMPKKTCDFDCEQIVMGDFPDGYKEAVEVDEDKAINVGGVYKDTVTGYEGVVLRRMTFLAGCTRYTLRGRVTKGNKLPEALVVAAGRLIAVDGAKAPEVRKSSTGGPRDKDAGAMASIMNR